MVNPSGNCDVLKGCTQRAPTWFMGTSTSAVVQATETGQVIVGTWAIGEWAYQVASP